MAWLKELGYCTVQKLEYIWYSYSYCPPVNDRPSRFQSLMCSRITFDADSGVS